jgi:uncharacterized protein YvpB
MEDMEIAKALDQFKTLFPKGIIGYALSVALFQDYVERMSKLTGESSKDITESIEVKAQFVYTQIEEEFNQLKVYKCDDGTGRMA